MYINDIFYNTEHLSINEKKNLLIDAKEKSYAWFIDKHDEHSIRQRIKYARFNTMLKLLDNKSHFVFILRGGTLNDINNNTKNKTIHQFIIETGFCTMGKKDGDYFLFIDIDKKHLNFFINNYNLFNTL